MTANGFSPSATVDKPMDQVYCFPAFLQREKQ